MATSVRFDALALVAFAGLHLIVGLAHTYAHVLADVQNTPLQLLFILLVVALAPWVAVFLFWKGRPRLGAALFAVSMAASFLFGYLLHFFIDSPDLYSRVAQQYRGVFLHSAIALAVVEFSGFALAVFIFLRRPSMH